MDTEESLIPESTHLLASELSHQLQLVQSHVITDPAVIERIGKQVTETLNSLFDIYIELFFTGAALQDMISFMCDSCTIEVCDPIPTTLTMFLTSAVTMTVTLVGLMPFRNMPMVIYPYTQMSKAQKQFMIQYIDIIRSCKAANVSTQMGGGYVLSLNKKSSRIFYVPHTSVLCSFCTKVMMNEAHSNLQTRYSICNIILQNIGTSIGISRETMCAIYKTLEHCYPRKGRENVSTISTPI
jgi:hypothetical protein